MRIEAEGVLIPYRTGDDKYSIFNKSIENYADVLFGKQKKPKAEKPMMTSAERDKKLHEIVERAKKQAKEKKK